jgi:hypothetical protein
MRLSLLASALVLLLAPIAALAQGGALPPVICDGLIGCGKGVSNLFFDQALPVAITVMMQVAVGGAMIFIVIAGVRMLVSYGDEGQVSTAKKGIMYALGGLGLALTSASIVAFVSTEQYVDPAPDALLGFMAATMRIILLLFNVAFALVIIAAGIRMVIAQGNADEFRKGGTVIKWAIIGAIIVNISKALVQAFLGLNL